MWISFSITNPEIRLTALLDRVVLPKGPVIFFPQTQMRWVSSPNRSPPHRKSSQMPGAPGVLPVFLSTPRCSSFLLVLHQPELAWSEKPVWLDCLTSPVGTKQESPRTPSFQVSLIFECKVCVLSVRHFSLTVKLKVHRHLFLSKVVIS